MSETQCPRCGGQLSADVLGGVCPACLLAAGVTAMQPSTGASPSGEVARFATVASRLTVILFSDVVGSTDLKSRVGAAAYSALLRRHNEIFERACAAVPDAQVLKHTGDGYMILFATASDAVRFALRAQAL